MFTLSSLYNAAGQVNNTLTGRPGCPPGFTMLSATFASPFQAYYCLNNDQSRCSASTWGGVWATFYGYCSAYNAVTGFCSCGSSFQSYLAVNASGTNRQITSVSPANPSPLSPSIVGGTFMLATHGVGTS